VAITRVHPVGEVGLRLETLGEDRRLAVSRSLDGRERAAGVAEQYRLPVKAVDERTDVLYPGRIGGRRSPWQELTSANTKLGCTVAAMPDNAHDPATIRLSLDRESRWTLHHVLLDRLEREARANDPTGIDPPPVAVFDAFETLDAGETSVTTAELEAMRAVVAEYHHSTSWWELERSRLEGLLHLLTALLEERGAAEA